jgi:hypothetical protein
MGAAHGRWDWQDAPVMTQSAELVDEARAVLDAVETALVRADTDMLMQLLDVKVQDMVRAYPAYSVATLRAEAERMMQYVALTDDPVPPRDPDEHDFRLVAGGRLLQLVDHDYKTSMAVRHHERGTRQPYRIMLARVGKLLRIVR